MKYLQGRKEFDLVIREDKIPIPQFNQVLVRVLACGICGTDIHYLKKSTNYQPLGHEISAIVVSIGENVTKVTVGEMVVVEDASPCGSCDNCKNGEFYLCRNTTGLNGQSGMGEYLVVHENNLVKCSNLTKEQATFVEPSAVAFTACLQADIREDKPLIIWGMGVQALMCVALGKYFHAKEIICVGHREESARSRKCEQLAMELGATEVTYTRYLKTREHLRDENCSVIVTSPPSTLTEAIRLVGYGSVIVPFGIALDDSTKTVIDLDDMILNKKQIKTVLTEPSCYFPRCIKLIEKEVIPTRRLLTHQISLTDTEQFRKIYMGDEAVVKGIIVNE